MDSRLRTARALFYVEQAKKDVNQLLGRDKKKKGRPTRKPAMHQPSPESVQVVPSPASSIFDRKPLPGIGQKSLQGGDKVESQTTTSSPPRSENTELLSDRPPSRTQPNNLVGHRLSRHLSVSAESDDANQLSEDDSKAQLREDADILKHRIDSATTSIKADHATALKVSIASAPKSGRFWSYLYIALTMPYLWVQGRGFCLDRRRRISAAVVDPFAEVKHVT